MPPVDLIREVGHPTPPGGPGSPGRSGRPPRSRRRGRERLVRSPIRRTSARPSGPLRAVVVRVSTRTRPCRPSRARDVIARSCPRTSEMVLSLCCGGGARRPRPHPCDSGGAPRRAAARLSSAMVLLHNESGGRADGHTISMWGRYFSRPRQPPAPSRGCRAVVNRSLGKRRAGKRLA